MNCHSTRLSKQTSGTAHSRPTQECQKMWLGDAGCVWWAHQSHNLFPQCHSAPISGGPCLSNSRFDCCRWWDTWLTHKQLNNTEGIQANLGCVWLWWTNNEHFPICLYSYSLRGTELAWTVSLSPSQAEMDLNWTGTKLDQSQGSCRTPFI